MSWQTYVDSNLIGTSKVSKAAILGQQGGVWATSSGFNLSAVEQKAIIDAYKNPASVLASGLKLEGQKYFGISADNRSIQLKKAADGVVIVKTKQAILVAVYVGPLQAPEVTPVVESLADYLISVGY